MTKLAKPLLLLSSCVAFAALPARANGMIANNDANRSGSTLNTAPTTSDYDTTTDDTLIYEDESFANDPTTGERMSAPPISRSTTWDAERSPVALDQNSELARNLKLHVSKNNALSIAGQNVKLVQVGDQIVLDGTAANAREANYISKLVNQFSKDQTVVNQLQLADEPTVNQETMETF